MSRQSLSVYHLQTLADTAFEDVLRDASSLRTFAPNPGLDLDFQSKLFLSISKLQHPTWLGLFADDFVDLDVPKVRRIDGVLLVRVSDEHMFALTFGHGRHLLKPHAIDRSYGLKVALNLIYDDDRESENSRIRSVDSKTVADNTINTRRQTDRRANFEAFEVDINRDFMRAITGNPTDSNSWGARISGGDSIHTNPVIEFSRLGQFCRDIVAAHANDAYKEEFNWIDKLRAVTDRTLLDRLWDLTLEKVRDDEDVITSVPELIQWDDVDHFRFSFHSDMTFADPEDASISAAVSELQEPPPLNLDNAKKWKLEAVASDGEITHSWSLIRCLSGELSLDDDTFVLSEGQFFQIDEDYLAELDAFVEEIPEFEQQLPVSENDPPEGDYNELAASSSDSYLLLDKKTVRVTNNTSAIEICDVFTADGAFIHVKRKLGSSSLSHLFAQGSVSADLLLMSPEYRAKATEKIETAENDRVDETDDTGFRGRFPRFNHAPVRPSDHEVVYAVVAKWADRSLAEGLPFFSKVNLRRHIEELKRMGYPVSFARIEVIET